MTQGDNQPTVEEELKEIKKWSRIQGLQSLAEVLRGFDDEELVMYNRADGESTMGDIAEHIPSGSSTVSNRMQEWEEQNLVSKEGRKWKHIAPLSSMGIEEPEFEDDEL